MYSVTIFFIWGCSPESAAARREAGLTSQAKNYFRYTVIYECQVCFSWPLLFTSIRVKFSRRTVADRRLLLLCSHLCGVGERLGNGEVSVPLLPSSDILKFRKHIFIFLAAWVTVFRQKEIFICYFFFPIWSRWSNWLSLWTHCTSLWKYNKRGEASFKNAVSQLKSKCRHLPFVFLPRERPFPAGLSLPDTIQNWSQLLPTKPGLYRWLIGFMLLEVDQSSMGYDCHVGACNLLTKSVVWDNVCQICSLLFPVFTVSVNFGDIVQSTLEIFVNPAGVVTLSISLLTFVF